MLHAGALPTRKLFSPPAGGQDLGRTAHEESTQTTVFHVTHWKAGSQWIHKILLQCWPERLVRPEVDMSQFLQRPLAAGKIYPTVYATREEFFSVPLPRRRAYFVVIRDLRDTLVSGYFSLRHSHPLHQGVSEWRGALGGWTLADGLIRLMTDGWLDKNAAIQRSWLEGGERLIRYEDLLENDLEILEPLLLDECGLTLERERLRAAIVANRFESLTGGRPRGQENAAVHERKGVAGDWRNYFAPRVKDAFKERYGRLLIETGYEHDLDW